MTQGPAFAPKEHVCGGETDDPQDMVAGGTFRMGSDRHLATHAASGLARV